ncbi:Protein CBR-BBS-2 [Caenorhabditis briggsae]|uniref:Protein CBR-BBS-2 n=1 Tax=Caenorhabditis briggsae TaxID=6238 RepID=A8XRG6_CAEBR|nr:Protein CBR-BBS-2 [Caenorhabditis briggsae]CAP35240.2 Protein CBR-BBS-2 [Caenorhabditis briggsae]
MDGDETPEEQFEIGDSSQVPHFDENVELKSVFNFSLNQRIMEGCVVSAILEPRGVETIVAVSMTNKVIIKDVESPLNITETIRCIAAAPIGDGYDCIVIGTDASVICYDVHNNLTVFRNDVPDGVNCFAYGKLGDLEEAIYCGGNCCIWGFDKTGANTYWTVTGDQVTTMCLSDYDGDGETELVIGSPDFEIRVFKNDLMRAELMETDEITSLAHVTNGCFAYSLNNGTIGTYVMKERQWRIKSKSNVSKIFNIEEQGLMVVVWKQGKVDLRFAHNGEVLSRDSVPTPVASATCSRNAEDATITVVCLDGKAKTFKVQKATSGAVDKTQQMIREFGQKKHNLMMELSNYEQEEQMTEAEKAGDFRIPADTEVGVMFIVNCEVQLLSLRVEATHNIPIRGVLIFAEGLFEGESYIWLVDIPNYKKNLLRIPPNEHQSRSAIDIPLVIDKDSTNDLHTKVFLGHVDSNKLMVMENTRILPRFCRFTPLKAEYSKFFIMPTGFIKFDINTRAAKLSEWVSESFTIDASLLDMFDEPEGEFKFMGLRPKHEKSLMFKITQSDKTFTIYHDDIETMGALVQSYASFFQIQHMECVANFPDVFKEAEEILEELEPMTEVRDRLTAELQERQAAVKEILIRAEDSIAIDDIPDARKFYIRLKANDAAARQAAQLRYRLYYGSGENLEKTFQMEQSRKMCEISETSEQDNRELLKTSWFVLTVVRNLILIFSVFFSVGEPGRQIVVTCRAAISEDNKQIVTKVLQYGASSQ